MNTNEKGALAPQTARPQLPPTFVFMSPLRQQGGASVTRTTLHIAPDLRPPTFVGGRANTKSKSREKPNRTFTSHRGYRVIGEDFLNVCHTRQSRAEDHIIGIHIQTQSNVTQQVRIGRALGTVEHVGT